jgi:hypothetical protein
MEPSIGLEAAAVAVDRRAQDLDVFLQAAACLLV